MRNQDGQNKISNTRIDRKSVASFYERGEFYNDLGFASHGIEASQQASKCSRAPCRNTTTRFPWGSAWKARILCVTTLIGPRNFLEAYPKRWHCWHHTSLPYSWPYHKRIVPFWNISDFFLLPPKHLTYHYVHVDEQTTQNQSLILLFWFNHLVSLADGIKNSISWSPEAGADSIEASEKLKP